MSGMFEFYDRFKELRDPSVKNCYQQPYLVISLKFGDSRVKIDLTNEYRSNFVIKGRDKSSIRVL